MAQRKFDGLIKKSLNRSMTQVDPKEYEAAWESVLECVDGMKDEFN